jgi:alpha-2-macroglobulin
MRLVDRSAREHAKAKTLAFVPAMGATAKAVAFMLFMCSAASAQEPADGIEPLTPAFTLSSSEAFTTRESPSFNLTFRHLTQLDFRVYKVRDAVAFFAGLRDPHQLGSEERPVARERSWIERIAEWKGRQRRTIRSFVRDQVSHDYRAVRRASIDRAEVAERVALNQTSFAQVPLLNPDQLVTSWRELLPDHREPEYRRVPLDVKEPGVYLVEAVAGLLRAYTIVMVSEIGLVTKAAPGQMLMFAADRFSGEPQADCDVQVLVDRQPTGTGTTAADGVFTVALPEAKVDNIVGIARCGAQVAITDPGGYFASEALRQFVGYVYTDKPVYRPGHTVHVKAVLRWRERDALLPFDRPNAEIAVSDLNDKVVFRQSVSPDNFGAVHATFPVPRTAALGAYNIRVASGEHQASGSFEVQEYRRPEFEVFVTPSNRFVVQGGEAVATVQARYYFGQPVANARVRYVVNRQPYYSPWRWLDVGDEDGGSQFWYGDNQTTEGELRLDAQGRGEIRVPLDVADDGRDYSARIEAQTTDASSRTVSGSTVVHATYASFLISTQINGYIFRPSQTVSTTARAVDYSGAPQGGVRVMFALERITYPAGRYADPVRTDVAKTEATTAADGTATASLTLPQAPGTYVVRATAPAGDRQVSSESWVWVAGPQDVPADEGDRYLELMADKRAYVPGDTARLVVRGETIAGPLLVTKEGQHVAWHAVLRPSAGDPIEVPIQAADVGDIYVHVAYMRGGRLYRAERRLSVPPTQQTLQITVTPERRVAKPQDPGVFSVTVADATGAPVSAQVSLGVIDEAVYAIRPDETPDPVRFFHRREYSRVGTAFSRDYYFTGFSGSERLQLAGRRRRPFTLADFKGDKEVQPQVRKEFPDAIYWLGDLVTNAEGQAKVSIKYPDALTTWRLTARAVTRDTKAGVAIARTTTTKDLIVRVITPRFLTEGDEVVLPTIAHNYLSDAKNTTVTIAAKGLERSGAADASRTSTSEAIASSGERRDDWRFRATTPTTAVVTAAARTDSDADAVELPIPVLPYGLRREVGSSGSLLADGETSTEVVVPATANAAGREISISLAPSLAGSLLGALDFLTSFPYGCTEQTLSSFLPNLLVLRTLAELKLAPTERLSALDRQVAAGLRRVGDLQHEDGGWGWWKTDENHPFMTAYALFGLAEAKRAGANVEEYRLVNGARALTELYAKYPDAEPDLKAYVAYALRRAQPETAAIGEYTHAAALEALWSARTRMTTYGRALLLQLLDEGKDARGNELAQGLIGEAQSRGELSWWASARDPLLFETVETSVEATALAVQALARRDPASPLLDRAVRWLMLNRRGGYWWNTKQTAFALYGLLEVLQARKETPQTFTVDVHVNGALAGSRTFTPASLTSPDPVIVSVPAREGANSVRLVKKGGGTLHWGARAVYYDTQGAQARSGSRQLAITRKYARLMPVRQRDRIVYQEQPFDGRMSPGDVLAVRVTIAGSNDWRYLIIEDPLPAGVEAVQDTTAYPMERPDRWRWWWGSQTEYRDNRTVFFQERFDGRAEFVYLVKAISSGEFRAIPAQVAPMYVPDVTASSEPVTVTVIPPQ